MEYSVGMKVFGDWEIVKGLGEGSFGTVYLLRKETTCPYQHLLIM